MMRGLVVVLCCGALVPLVGASHAFAAPPPPPPPPTPSSCQRCVGPPPPPSRATPVPPSRSTPVPTLAPQAAAPVQVVAVHLVPARVRRGHQARLNLTAPPSATVTVSIQYRSGKQQVLHTRIGQSGSIVQSWTVPKSTPVGKASVRITVGSDGTPYSTVLDFAVTR